MHFDPSRALKMNNSSINDENVTQPQTLTLSYKIKAGLFLATAGSIGFLSGFSGALAQSKKQDPESFDKGLLSKMTKSERQRIILHESGAKLASKALAYGTLYAIGGFSVLCFGLWKLSGASDLQEFRYKAGRILPRIPKNDPPQSRTEFSGINDFLQYVIDKDMEEKKLKSESHNNKKE